MKKFFISLLAFIMLISCSNESLLDINSADNAIDEEVINEQSLLTDVTLSASSLKSKFSVATLGTKTTTPSVSSQISDLEKKSTATQTYTTINPGIAKVIAPCNGTMMQYFHWYTPDGGVHWNTVKNNASSLAEIGITALWLPPAYKGSSKYDVGYGVYDMYDLGEFNQKDTVATKYGTKDQYLSAINEAHKYGINIYADVVFNHRGSADYTEWFDAVRCASDNRNYEYGGKTRIEGWTGFNFPGRNNRYSSFKWHWYHFDGVDYAANNGENAVFRILGDGKGWDWEVDGENGNYDYLMYADLDMNHPEVVQELKNWAKWYVDFANLDGFRMDAVKHIKYGFFNDWLTYVRNQTGKELFTVGEYWNYDVGKLNHFIDATQGCMSLFDAPIHMNFYQASKQGGNYDMGGIFNGTLTQANPMKSVSIVENHDTQPCQALESCVDWWFKPLAYALILLRESGYPCVFYADLYGAEYDDKGYHINMAPVKNLDKLIRVRKDYAYGTQHDYFDHSDVIGWTREGNKTKDIATQITNGCAVVMSDRNGSSKRMYMGSKFAGKQMYDYLGNNSTIVTVDSNGYGTFPCNGGSVSVYVVAEGLTATKSVKATVESWIWNDSTPVFVWAWGTNSTGAWIKASGSGTTATFTLPKGTTGFNMVRCYKGTTTPNWNTTGNKIGRIYNKTYDVAVNNNTTTYSTTWVEFTP